MKFISYSFKGSSTVSKLLVIFGLTVSLAGCQWGDEVESLIQPNPDEFAVLFSDTSTVKLSTFFTDSMMTGSANRHLVGRFADPYLGKLQASAYFQNAPQSGITVPALAEFDSLTLSLRYDTYSYGDTTLPLNISVHKVLKDLSEYSSVYNITKLPFEVAPIGKTKLIPRPKTNKSLKIRLSQALGQEIFDKAKDNLITSAAVWNTLIQGLVVKAADTDNASVIGFRADTSTAIRLHYHTAEVEGIKKDSTSVGLSYIFNQIIPDRTGTLLAKAPATHRIALPSEQTGNKSFIQAGPGVMTRVDFPHLSILKANKYTVVNRAFLRLTPLQLSVTNQFRAPAQIHVFICDKNNEFIRDASGLPLPLYDLNSTNTQNPRPVVGTYVNDLINNTQYYLFDVSYYVSNLMNSGVPDGTGLVLRSSTFTGSPSFPDANSEFSKGVDRLVIGDQSTGNKNVKLELFYTVAEAK